MRWSSAEQYVCRCRDAGTNCAAIDGEDFLPHRSTLARGPGPSGLGGLAGHSRSAVGQNEHARVIAAVVGKLAVVGRLAAVESVVVLGNEAGGC